MDRPEKLFLIEALKKEMPEYNFEFQKVALLNDNVKEKVFIDFDGINKAPLFDPDDYQGKSFSDIANEMRQKLELLGVVQYKIRDTILSDSFIKNNIRLQLVSTPRNRTFLKDKPHFKVNNELSAVFYVPLSKNGMERGIIANGLFEELTLDLSELKQAALKNMGTEIELQYTAEIADNIESGIEEVMHGKDMPEILDKLQKGKLDKMVVLSNRKREYGAATILCNDFLKNCNQDLVVLPSSTHEVMLLPYSGNAADLKEIQSIVEYVNFTTIPERDILSDSVYLFDHKAQQISLACDRFGLVPICDDTLLKLPEIISKKR